MDPIHKMLWKTENEKYIDDAVDAMMQEFPADTIATDVGRDGVSATWDEDVDVAIARSIEILLAQMRNMIATVVYSTNCGCRSCRGRLTVTNAVYRETIAAARTLQSIRAAQRIVPTAADTDDHSAGVKHGGK